jgi:MoaA/NifB/PqqE/SkfB family radical SAM enzyme
MLEFRKSKPLYTIHSPCDEEFFGGCVSAGRGFAHVTPEGDVTPCPVSNVATHNLKNSSLREALASPLFGEIRRNEHLLETEGLPCALFAHPEEVEELARSVGAYKTSG